MQSMGLDPADAVSGGIFNLGKFNGEVLVAVVDDTPTTVVKSMRAIDPNNWPIPTTLFEATGVSFKDGSCQEANNNLYIHIMNTATDTIKIYKWDGVTLAVDDEVSTSAGADIRYPQGRLATTGAGVLAYTSFLGGTATVRRLSGGTWSTFASTALAEQLDFITYFSTNGNYYAGTTSAIYAISSGSITNVNGFTNSLESIHQFGANLYYTLVNGINQTTVIGKFDGATWNDTWITGIAGGNDLSGAELFTWNDNLFLIATNKLYVIDTGAATATEESSDFTGFGNTDVVITLS